MNKKIILLSSIFLMALTSQSCSNDYLDVEPTQSISAEDLSL
jgi:hypothetical protein